jgi:hypothetical protein
MVCLFAFVRAADLTAMLLGIYQPLLRYRPSRTECSSGLMGAGTSLQ